VAIWLTKASILASSMVGRMDMAPWSVTRRAVP
jgi:hypothetical protein